MAVQKERTSFSLSPRSLELLLLVSKAEKRSKANMVEYLIEEKAKALNIGLPADWEPPKKTPPPEQE